RGAESKLHGTRVTGGQPVAGVLGLDQDVERLSGLDTVRDDHLQMGGRPGGRREGRKELAETTFMQQAEAAGHGPVFEGEDGGPEGAGRATARLGRASAAEPAGEQHGSTSCNKRPKLPGSTGPPIRGGRGFVGAARGRGKGSPLANARGSD